MSTTPVYTLPNGLTVYHHRRYETDFVYREVFIDQIYTKPFPDLPTNACIVDVGANMGLFSLFIKQQFPAAHVYAFEPAPVHFKILEQNLKAYSDVHLFALGLGEKQTQKTFTYYPDYSLLSGFHGDAQQDQRLLSAGIAQQLRQGSTHPADDTEKYIELLVQGKLDNSQQFTCDITTLSTVIEQEKIQTLDLLKIDAEKAELDVLQGIQETDWQKIHRLVIEAHDTPVCDAICSLLKQQGYRVDSRKTADFNKTTIYTISAYR